MARAMTACGAITALCVLAVVGCSEREGPELTNGITPAQHDDFPITAGTAHALDFEAADGPISCNSCHGTEGSFARFSCVGCHEHRKTGLDTDGTAGMDDQHRAVTLYEYESNACLRCHPTGVAAELSRVEHDEFFPIEKDTAHFRTNCSECHIDEGNRTVVTCTGCHTDGNDDGFGDHSLLAMRAAHGPEMQNLGYEWTTAKCLECHERSQVPGLLVHEPFPTAADDVHEDIACADCHNTPADRTNISCTSCHEQVDDGGGDRDVHGDARMFEVHENGDVPGYAFESRSCYTCHQDAQVPGALDHEELFPIGTDTVHELDTLIDEPPTLVECASCHESEVYEDVTCTGCHAHAQPETDAQHSGFPEYEYVSSACVFCHKGGVRNFDHGLASDFPVSALTDSHKLDDTTTTTIDGLACGDCHASAENRAQMRCASCHDHEQPTELEHHGAELSRFGYAWESGACLECHQTSQVPGLIDHEPEFPLKPPSGNGAHQPLSCVDCHTDRQNRAASLACTTCHQPTSPVDDREVHSEPRLGEVHDAFPEYIWTPQSCIGCHADGTADGAAENLEHVWFPVAEGATHAVEARGGTLLCVDCHATPGDYTVATIACVTCHQQIDDGDGAGARDVHGEPRIDGIHAGVDGYLFDSPSCLECHPQGEPTGNFNHIEFPIVVGTAHEGIACTECHAPGPPKSDLAALQCKQCHDARVNLNPTVTQVHSGLPGFVDASPSCYGCHPNSERSPPFDHDPFFPVAAGTPHDSLACTDCHTNPSSRPQVTCTGCHTDQNGDGLFDHDVSAMLAEHGPDMASMGYAWTTAACRSCHARAQVPGLLDHASAFPIALGTVHSGRQCTECHTSVQDRSQLSCTACHQQVDDGTGARDVHGEPRMEEVHVTTGTVPGYSFDARACYGCHQQAQVPGVMDHDAFFPIGPTSFHPLGASIDTPAVLVECTTCHLDSANQRNGTCTSCHAHEQPAMDASHAGFPDYAYSSTSCVFCHQGGLKRLDHAQAAAFPVSSAGDTHKLDEPLTGAVDGLLCSECHASQSDRSQLRCASCHHTVAQSDLDHGTAMSRYGYRYDSGACYACHATAQVPGVFDHEPIFPLLPPSGVTSHQGLSCADCHASKADRAGSLTCTECHQPTSAQDPRDVHGQPRLAEVHNGFADYQWSPASCLGCHADGTAASAAQNLNHVWFPTSAGTTHALTSVGGQIACADCHTTAGDYARFECIQCHLTVNDGGGAREVHSNARMTELHAGVGGFVYSSVECYACHPNGEPSGTFDHTGFPIVLGTAHEAVSCSECHTGTAPKNDLTALGCAQCHATENTAPNTIAAIHNGIPDFANNSPACFMCHPNAEPVGPMEHGAFFPIAAGSAHASAAYMAKVTSTQTSCSACHASRTDRSNELCATCHATVPVIPSTAHTAVRGFSNTSPLCKACHADAQVLRLTSHPRDGTRSWHSHRNSTCQNCHIDQAACLASATCYNNTAGGQPNPAASPAYRSDKPWAFDFDRYGCLGCHEHKKSSMDSRHDQVNGYSSYNVPPCIQCHNP